jgi:hypothetical protein
MKTKRNYYFFWERDNKCHLFEELECKSPDRTNVYKELGAALNKGLITGYGYTTDKTDRIFY